MSKRRLHQFFFIAVSMQCMQSCRASPPQSEYRGRQMHPTMQVQLRHAFAPWNQELFRLIGQTLNWADEER